MNGKVVSIDSKRIEREQQLSKETLNSKFKEHFPLLESDILINRFDRLVDFSPEVAKAMFDSLEKTKLQHSEKFNFNRYAWQFEFFNSAFYSSGVGTLKGVEAVLNDFEKNPQIDPRDVLLAIKKQITELNELFQDNPFYRDDTMSEPQYTLPCTAGQNVTAIDPVHLEEETLLIIGVVINDSTHYDFNELHQRTIEIDPVTMKEESYEVGNDFWFCQFSIDVAVTRGDETVTISGGLEYNPATAVTTTKASSTNPTLISIDALIVERVSSPT